jgi:membrane-associated phospholipid phosphatase
MASSTARADDATTAGQLRWDPAWTHAGPDDFVLTAFAVEDLVIYEAFAQSKQPQLRWSGPILFDQAVRDVLRGSTPGVRSAAATTSWTLLAVEVAYPAVIDVPYALRRYGPGVAWDLFWQDATALSIASAVDMDLRDFVGRARPQAAACLAGGGSASQCLGTDSEATRSFPGGHVAIVTTAALLTCTQHLSLRLYGAPWDAIACVAAITTDAAVGTLRIVADDHYATDILAGYALGAAIGWGIPFVMHLHGHAAAPTDPGTHVAPVAIPVNRGAGMGVTGWF